MHACVRKLSERVLLQSQGANQETTWTPGGRVQNRNEARRAPVAEAQAGGHRLPLCLQGLRLADTCAWKGARTWTGGPQP